jgi:hypothetical protein
MFALNFLSKIVWVSAVPLQAGTVLFPEEVPGLVLRVHRAVTREEAADILGVPPPDRFQHFYECLRVPAPPPPSCEFGAS